MGGGQAASEQIAIRRERQEGKKEKRNIDGEGPAKGCASTWRQAVMRVRDVCWMESELSRAAVPNLPKVEAL